jgi:hypothetical protein
MQSSFCIGKANVTVLSRQGTKENQQMKHNTVRRDVTTPLLREKSQRSMTLLLPRASILPNCWCPGLARPKADRQAVPKSGRKEHENATQRTTRDKARNLQILQQTRLPAHSLPSKDERCQGQGRRVAKAFPRQLPWSGTTDVDSAVTPFSVDLLPSSQAKQTSRKSNKGKTNYPNNFSPQQAK